MSQDNSETSKSAKRADKSKDRAAEIANTFEWLITAFILAFVFRAFVMEAFRIPTGSMADTLKGAHFRMRCEQCGYKYDHGFMPERYGFGQDTMPAHKIEPPPTRCPSCGYYPPKRKPLPVANGDRILVLKCIYQFFEPKQWDVIVFKNPLAPHINYIKRLIGRPGETIEIIDGDVYIDGQISRKPSKVQNELWMPVYDNDYQPVNSDPDEGYFNGHRWAQPFNLSGSKWVIDENSPTLLHLDSAADEINSFSYDSSIGNTPNATYAYGEVRGYRDLPYCSDLMLRFHVRVDGDSAGYIGAALSKYERNYRAWIDLSGEMVIAKVVEGKETPLARKSIDPPAEGKSTLFKFANVDHQLIFKFGGAELTHDIGRKVDAAGPIKREIEPRVEIFGSGKLTLMHIAIFRDIYYTEPRSGSKPSKAAEGNPFRLEEDEFFALGDNSPNSEDGRLWRGEGKANKGQKPYREGVVPRDYLVGKALFVYWPSGFDFPWPQRLKTFLLRKSETEHNRILRGIFRVTHMIVSLRWIPNIGQVRFIYGGSDKRLMAEGRRAQSP